MVLSRGVRTRLRQDTQKVCLARFRLVTNLAKDFSILLDVNWMKNPYEAPTAQPSWLPSILFRPENGSMAIDSSYA